MPAWTVKSPETFQFDEVKALRVRLFAGSVAVLASDERPSVSVTAIDGRPLVVSHNDGVLTVAYEELSWDHLLEWLRPNSHRAEVMVTVPVGCDVQLGVVSATALVSGLSAGAAVKSVSGGITLDGVTGDVTARSVSGDVSARDMDGAVRFESVSGDLTLADGVVRSLRAETVAGDVFADAELAEAGSIQVTNVSGKVTLRLPADTNAKVRLNTMSGKITSDFASLRSTRSPASRSVNGEVGAGSGRLSVTSVSGAVTLLRRAKVESEIR
jgi:hypothetical protein